MNCAVRSACTAERLEQFSLQHRAIPPIRKCARSSVALSSRPNCAPQPSSPPAGGAVGEDPRQDLAVASVGKLGDGEAWIR